MAMSISSSPPRPVRGKQTAGRKPQPRSLLIDSREFGRSPRTRFAEPLTELDWGLVAGAKEQHRIATNVRSFIQLHRISLMNLAEQTHMDYQRLSRILRGAAWMTIEDLGRMTEALPEAFGRRNVNNAGETVGETSEGAALQRLAQHQKKPPTNEAIDLLDWPSATP